jgi:hypothetical protein
MLLADKLGKVTGPHTPSKRWIGRLRGHGFRVQVSFEVFETQRDYFRGEVTAV